MSATEIPIVHGDGRWVIYRKSDTAPWTRGAVMSAAVVWGRHAYANRDWAKSSVAHGNSKIMGEMPAGVPLQDKSTRQLTPEAAKFMELLVAMMGDLPIGIRPAGSKVDILANASTNWQVFERLVLNAEKAGARIYLGTDGTLGTNSGAPGIDITALFGVASTLVEGDLKCMGRCFYEGVLIPWTAVNFGDSSLAPQRRYLLPDADEEARDESYEKRLAAFFSTIERARGLGFDVTEEYVESVAEKFRIDAPALPKQSTDAPKIALAPTDIARVVSVNEARASAGLGPLVLPGGGEDPDGRLTVEEYAAKKKAGAEATAQPAPALRAVP